jgi:hypothetical protein
VPIYILARDAALKPAERWHRAARLGLAAQHQPDLFAADNQSASESAAISTWSSADQRPAPVSRLSRGAGKRVTTVIGESAHGVFDPPQARFRRRALGFGSQEKFDHRNVPNNKDDY